MTHIIVRGGSDGDECVTLIDTVTTLETGYGVEAYISKPDGFEDAVPPDTDAYYLLSIGDTEWDYNGVEVVSDIYYKLYFLRGENETYIGVEIDYLLLDTSDYSLVGDQHVVLKQCPHAE